jgi:hypothetical protein
MLFYSLSQHLGMVQAAEVGAATKEASRVCGREVEIVRHPGQGVAREVELRHREPVHHVIGHEAEGCRLTHGELEGRIERGAFRDGRHPIGRVVELPPPLEPCHIDAQRRMLGNRIDLVLHPHREEEQHRHDQLKYLLTDVYRDDLPSFLYHL